MRQISRIVFFFLLLGPGQIAVLDITVVEKYGSKVAETRKSQEDFTPLCEKTPPNNLNDLIHQAGREFDVPPRVIALTIFRESKCDSKALGSSGEIGLMQINPSVWEDLLVKQGFNIRSPQDNVRAGAFIISHLVSRSNGVWETLRRYNGSGPKAEAYAFEQIDTYHKIWNERLKIPKNPPCPL